MRKPQVTPRSGPAGRTPSRALDIRVIVDGDSAAGRRLATGVAEFARGRPDWYLHLDLNPLGIGSDDSKADGTVYGSHLGALVERFRSGNRPVVGCLAHVEPYGIPVVRVDDRAVGTLAARHFMDRGFERFVFDSLRDRSLAASLRWEGFRDTVQAAGFTAAWRPGEADGALQDPLAASVVRGRREPIALLAGHDAVGREAARALSSQGIAIPDEVAILGVDDDEFQCMFGRPSLSSVAVPYPEIGRRAAELLARMLDGETVPAGPQLVAPTEVRTRDSTDIVCVDDPRLARALRIIREHACAPCDVKQLALQAGVSRRWLEKEFRKRYDRSPFDAILQVRMERAKVLLREPLVPLKRVAAECGYSHPQNFVSAFREAVGETPGEYRHRFAPR